MSTMKVIGICRNSSIPKIRLTKEYRSTGERSKAKRRSLQFASAVTLAQMLSVKAICNPENTLHPEIRATKKWKMM
jgi:hypothetical protein